MKLPRLKYFGTGVAQTRSSAGCSLSLFFLFCSRGSQTLSRDSKLGRVAKVKT
jgi:hypothetical protein